MVKEVSVLVAVVILHGALGTTRCASGEAREAGSPTQIPCSNAGRFQAITHKGDMGGLSAASRQCI